LLSPNTLTGLKKWMRQKPPQSAFPLRLFIVDAFGQALPRASRHVFGPSIFTLRLACICSVIVKAIAYVINVLDMSNRWLQATRILFGEVLPCCDNGAIQNRKEAPVGNPSGPNQIALPLIPYPCTTLHTDKGFPSGGRCTIDTGSQQLSTSHLTGRKFEK
jgi:hypothetical protein